MAKRYNSKSSNNKSRPEVLADTSKHGAGQPIDPAHHQLPSEQTPGVKPYPMTVTKLSNTSNRRVGYEMRGARKELRKRGKM